MDDYKKRIFEKKFGDIIGKSIESVLVSTDKVPLRCSHVACSGVTANGRRVVAAIDSQRCEAAVLYGDERCVMTREDKSSYCVHHQGGQCKGMLR